MSRHVRRNPLGLVVAASITILSFVYTALRHTAADSRSVPWSEPSSASRRFRVVYGIRTNTRNVETKLPAVLRTWASSLAKEDLFIISTKSDEIAMGPEYTFPVHGTKCADNRQLGLTCIEAHIHLYADQHAGSFDWLVVIDEDVFVHTENVKLVLSKIRPSDAVVWAVPGCGGDVCNPVGAGLCGGAGYAISGQNLRRVISDSSTYVARLMKSRGADTYCDVAVGCMAESSGLRIQRLEGMYPWKLAERELKEALEGTEALPLTFHYTKPQEMLELRDRLKEIADARAHLPPDEVEIRQRMIPTGRCPSMRFFGGYKDGKGGKLPDGDGGTWVCDPEEIAKAAEDSSGPGCLIYSIGSDGEFSWEIAIHEQISGGCEIHTFDKHDIEWYLRPEYNPGYPHKPNPSFVKYHVAELSSGRNIADLVKELGHSGRTIQMLKVSCDGCEWSTYTDWLNGDADIRQIFVKVHNYKREFTRFFAQKGYALFHSDSARGQMAYVKVPNSAPAVKVPLSSSKVVVPLSASAGSSACMLVPVYPAHFAALAARMAMLSRNNLGPVIKTVVVFGDAAEHADFCKGYPDACLNGSGFHPTNLDVLIGPAEHKQLKQQLNMEQPYVSFEYGGPRFGCWPKSSGRVYQTVKKFYGAAFGPAECRTYWVCDAETLPFRKHNLSEHLELNTKFPKLVISGWHDEPKCANVQADDGTDQSCAVLMSNITNGMRFPNDTKPSIFTSKRWKQVFLFVDQWWFYERTVTSDWLRFLEVATKMHAWSVFSYYRFSDMSVYGMMMHWSAYYAHPGRSKILNIRQQINATDPEAFESCCICPATPSAEVPRCSTVSELLSDGGCLSRIPIQKRLSVAVEGLGFFGIGNYLRFMYVSAQAFALTTKEGHGLHWCYINCFKKDLQNRILTLPRADMDGINKFNAVFENTHV